MQPSVQRRSQVGIAERSVCAAALCVPADDHLLDLEVSNGVLDDGRGVDVIGVHAVGDVAVYKDVARPAVADGRLWNAAVGAAYPQDLGPLAFSELCEGIRVGLGRVLGEDAVTGNDSVDRV